MSRLRQGGWRKPLLAAAVGCATVAAGLVALPALGASQAAAPAFRVLAFYNGTWDAAHIDFDREANAWFPQAAARYGFSWESTTDWSRLNATNLAGYQVVMFLDDAPPASARPAFEQYMRGGGAWFGFHVAAFTTDPGAWSWYYDTLLGSGAFRSNTWGPTAVALRIDDAAHPATRGLAATIPSSVSEWYAWSGNLRGNPAIDVLASIDPSSFPVGTDPSQSWTGGDYPIMWSNRNYRMVYANFGHNAMNYATNTRLSETFGVAEQNQFVINSLLWLGGAEGTPSPTAPGTPSPSAAPSIDPETWYTVVNDGSGLCVDARGAASANGTAVQQYPCNGTDAQRWQFQATGDGYLRINSRLDAARVVDVTDRSTADRAPLQLWSYTGGTNQQWRAVAGGGGSLRLVGRAGGRCVDVPAASTAAGVQLQQYTCNGTAAQSFRLVAGL